MAECTPFNVTVTGDLTATLARIKSDVESHGGTFSGDLTGGTLSGSLPLMGPFQVEYTVNGNTVTITVTDRPFLIPCSIIESQLQTYFTNV